MRVRESSHCGSARWAYCLKVTPAALNLPLSQDFTIQVPVPP